MKIAETVDEADFRQQVRAWLVANVPREPRPEEADAQRDFDVAWRRRQFDGGWGHIAWPGPYGGRGLPLASQIIWFEECARAKAPGHIDMFFVALQHAGPTLIACGNERQKSFHLPLILRGEAIWCQGFSEPGAGSDLAAIRTRGEVDGDSLVINGQKIWTSFGRSARYQELLIRTDPASSRHQGLTFVICDMSTPGIEVRPIRNLVGGDDFCEVFYDDVRVPLENVVGDLGKGWEVAMSTLGFERGAASIPQVIELTRGVEELLEYVASSTSGHHAPPFAASEIGAKLAAARADAAALKAMVHLMIARNAAGSEGSMVRLFLSELAQRVSNIAMDILGPDSLDRDALGGWPRHYLLALKHTIAGGTSEIQRNIIGERILGLPRGAKGR